MKNIVHCVKCEDFMKTIPSLFYDLAICDPPYGIFDEAKMTGFIQKYITSKNANKWDTRPSPEYFKELFRISRHQIIWGLQYFTADLPDFTSPIIWDKCTGESYFADAELAYCSLPGTARIFKHQWAGCFKASERGEKAIQECQKPVALYEWVLKNYAKPSWKTFDSHEGSGANRIACHNLGFYHEGCEADAGNWEKQEERYKKHISKEYRFEASVKEDKRKGQPNLFEVSV